MVGIKGGGRAVHNWEVVTLGLAMLDVMRPKHVNILLQLAWAISFCSVTAAAQADSFAPPFSYSKASPDGRFLFVMIARGAVEDDARNWNEKKAAEIRAIRSTYAQSGLYRNDGSSTPLWTVNWYAYDVDFASNGIHLVRHGPWASRADQEAFSFFANGNLIRTYAISELVDLEPLLPHSVSHFQWSERAQLDDTALRYAVSTKDGNAFVFDMTNGSIVQERRVIKWAGFVAVVIVAVALIAALLRRQVPKVRAPAAV